jgi:hypothetical protein
MFGRPLSPEELEMIRNQIESMPEAPETAVQHSAAIGGAADMASTSSNSRV